MAERDQTTTPIRSAVTLSLVPEARGGPFVFWEDVDGACASAAALRFDALEIFPPGPEVFADGQIEAALSRHHLRLAAVGTGAGWVKHRLSLTDADPHVREKAVAFVRTIIDAGARFGAPAIIGSMQGRWGPDVPRETAENHLRDALAALGEHAKARGVTLLYEPLNRYETNLINTIDAGVELLGRLSVPNVRLLADLFHMNVEEADLPAAIRAGGRFIGHVHLADSNRRAAGFGHTDFAPIAAALGEVGYAGYVSAEAFPFPDSAGAARATIDAFNLHFRP